MKQNEYGSSKGGEKINMNEVVEQTPQSTDRMIKVNATG